MRTDVAALYVDPRGPYPGLVADWYDERRDARTYAGPHPIVAHPPCGPWGRLRHLSKRDDPQLALDAVEQVRRWGGVLEHPRRSLLWEARGLPPPGHLPDAWGGVTIAVDQVDFGHVARKATWLYVVGVSGHIERPPKREPTHWIGGFRKGGGRRSPERYRKTGSAVPPGIKVCSAEQRRRTPPAFAKWLLELASRARREIDTGQLTVCTG